MVGGVKDKSCPNPPEVPSHNPTKLERDGGCGLRVTERLRTPKLESGGPPNLGCFEAEFKASLLIPKARVDGPAPPPRRPPLASPPRGGAWSP